MYPYSVASVVIITLSYIAKSITLRCSRAQLNHLSRNHARFYMRNRERQLGKMVLVDHPYLEPSIVRVMLVRFTRSSKRLIFINKLVLSILPFRSRLIVGEGIDELFQPVGMDSPV